MERKGGEGGRGNERKEARYVPRQSGKDRQGDSARDASALQRVKVVLGLQGGSGRGGWGARDIFFILS